MKVKLKTNLAWFFLFSGGGGGGGSEEMKKKLFSVIHYLTGVSFSREWKDLIFFPETALGGVLQKKMFLKILQNSQENTSARVFFLVKLQTEALKICGTLPGNCFCLSLMK